MSATPTGAWPRWSVVRLADCQALLPGVDGRAAGQQGHGLGRPAVVAQRGQSRSLPFKLFELAGVDAVR